MSTNVCIDTDGIIYSNTIIADVYAGPIYTFPRYRGEYVAIPAIGEQVFATKEKSLYENFIVRPIPYEEVDNLAGGKTVIIAAV